ncbi:MULTISPECIES: type II toxin-antitoxin system Phd/YefM family antitoxin [Saccharothrix]|uniref:type II toxin-antitoxin system Phd/YefM family antitoxin n=1 Tax=Saccharothrix TaxID=2071 RepID=UPI0009613ECE|nr:type II toxin-antitoxin system Phd/YefM family antitoxin [Saccharothrix sp. CB00851]OKI34537.1 hypothetical protein A6A25_25015 [Saccharothrix sp. CB00851]
MKIDSDDMISVSDANAKGISKLVAEASAGQTRVVMRNNQPAAAIVDIKTMTRLQRLDELEDDMRLLSVAWVRALTDSGARHRLDDVLADLDIDLGEDEDED